MENELVKCPICLGIGEIEQPKKKLSDMRKSMAEILIKHGYGTREIQRFLQYRSTRSVTYIKKHMKF